MCILCFLSAVCFQVVFLGYSLILFIVTQGSRRLSSLGCQAQATIPSNPANVVPLTRECIIHCVSKNVT